MILIRNYKITALCLCTIIGAGFATGKELVTYFVSFGIVGFFGILISSILFSLVIHRIMLLPVNTLEEFLAPYPFNKIFLIVVHLFLLVLYSAMLSAGGEVLHSIFRLNKIISSILVAIATTLVISKGYDSLSDLSQILFIPIVLIIFIISLTTTSTNITIPPLTVVTPKALLSPIIYVSYNMLTTIPLLISIPDKYLYRSCGNQVGTVIFMLSSMLILPLYTHYSDIYNSTLPLVELLSGTIKYLYQFLLILAIFSTSASSAYSLMHSTKINNSILTLLVINISALALSLLGFTSIVNKVYFIFGIVGILILLILFLPKSLYTNNNQK